MWTISLMVLFTQQKNLQFYDQIINNGNNREIAICDLVHKIHELSESKSEASHWSFRKPSYGNMERMCADNSELQTLSWSPKDRL